METQLHGPDRDRDITVLYVQLACFCTPKLLTTVHIWFSDSIDLFQERKNVLNIKISLSTEVTCNTSLYYLYFCIIKILL
jgi:hypothetical protein